ncbi:MAG: M50 family metallopeptidase [Clostridiales bacterium]|nr:M50 family metallopeptidase [Clostridiales bacterium]
MKRTNVIFSVLVIILTVGTLLAVTLIASASYGGEMWKIVLLLVAGAVACGLVNAFAHELGHLIAGKINGFKFSEMTVWFFRWYKVREKICFSFVLMKEQAGYTEMFPKGNNDVARRYNKMTLGGLIASFVCMLIGIVPLFMTAYLPLVAYSFTSMMLPVGAYYFFGNALPVVSGGARNDGAVVLEYIKKEDSVKVMEGLLAIQAELYLGKTPSEIEEKYYFDLPQLPEDDLYFIQLLHARYDYYLDKGDVENAIKTTNRLLELDEYMPKHYVNLVKTDNLYNACALVKDEEKADDLMYELEKCLSVNNALSIRAKTAYLVYVKEEFDDVDAFIEKWAEEAEKSVFEGEELFNKKLLEKLKNHVELKRDIVAE